MRSTPLILMLCTVILCSRGASAQRLSAHVDVTIGTSTWDYMLVNDEPAGSPNFIAAFALAVDAPIVVTGTPVGWNFQTDNTSFVLWLNADSALPYPHDVAPGASLSGFEIQSTSNSSQESPYGISSWDHTADMPGPATSGTVLAPFVPRSEEQ